MEKLSNKQQLFINAYLVCWNATEAARRAKYAHPNKQGPRLLVNVGIKTAIEQRIAELKANADEVLLRLAEHSRGSIEDFIGSDNGVDIESAKTKNKLHLVRKLKQTTRYDKDGGKSTTLEIELYDAQAATVQLGRAMGLFIDKTALTDPTGKHEFVLVTAEAKEQSAKELAEWRKQQTDALLNGSIAQVTPAILPSTTQS